MGMFDQGQGNYEKQIDEVCSNHASTLDSIAMEADRRIEDLEGQITDLTTKLEIAADEYEYAQEEIRDLQAQLRDKE